MNLCIVCQEQNSSHLQFCDHCGTELVRLPRNQKGHLLPGVILERRYQIQEILGRGGFANAYLAQDSRLGRACVVKEMWFAVDASREDMRDIERHFEREVQSLVALNHPGHPNIPEIYDYFSLPHAHYLVMKYIEGHNLEQVLETEGHLPWQEALRIVIRICDALVYMHARQPEPVLHRDIKPANILVDQANRIWLVDFGLSKPLNGFSSHTNFKETTALGTAGYTSLEQWMEQAVPASDIYALGATLHHLLTGRDPRLVFSSEPSLSKVILEHSKFPALQDFDKNLPAELEIWVRAATHAESKKRPTASQWKQALEDLLYRHQLAKLFQEEVELPAQKPDATFSTFLRLRAQSETLALSQKDREQWLRKTQPNIKNPLSSKERLSATIWGGTLGAVIGVIVWDNLAQWLLLDAFEANRLAILGLAATLNFVLGKLTYFEFTDPNLQEWQNALLVHFLTGAINLSVGVMVIMKLGVMDLSEIFFEYFLSLIFSFSALILVALLDKAFSSRLNAEFREGLVLFAFGWPFILMGMLWAIPMTIVRYLRHQWLNVS